MVWGGGALPFSIVLIASSLAKPEPDQAVSAFIKTLSGRGLDAGAFSLSALFRC